MCASISGCPDLISASSVHGGFNRLLGFTCDSILACSVFPCLVIYPFANDTILDYNTI
jgi:hypothetical protein